MLNTPPLVRAQLSEALTLISGHDFPAAWPQLLPELVERLAGALSLRTRVRRRNGHCSNSHSHSRVDLQQASGQL
jgi:hypothetical protein